MKTITTPTAAVAAWKSLEAKSSQIEKSEVSKFTRVGEIGLIFESLRTYYKGTATAAEFIQICEGKGWKKAAAYRYSQIGRALNDRKPIEAAESFVKSEKFKSEVIVYLNFLKGKKSTEVEKSRNILSVSLGKEAIKIKSVFDDGFEARIKALIEAEISKEKQRQASAKTKLQTSQLADEKARKLAAQKAAKLAAK